jgi:DNA-binding XRE family transcriptional regulator
MYRNLEAEMIREGVTRKDLAEALGVRYATVIDKLKGRYSFTLDEAFIIRNKFFPHLSFEYLFERNENKTA